MKSKIFVAASLTHRRVHQQGLAHVLPLLIAAVLVLALVLGVNSSMRISKNPALGSTQSGAAQGQDESYDGQRAVVLERLAALGFEDVSLAPGHTAGWYAVSTHQGLYYMDVTGEFLLAGQWYAVSDPAAVVNLTEQANARMRIAQLTEQQSSAIVYGDPDARYQVSVFTDHTCGYCRRMHQVLDDYLAADIAIHYYAFPRAGLQSSGAEQLAAIWCAEDPKGALDRAKLSGDTDQLAAPSAACSTQVAEHLQMGRALGVQGTPAIVLPDGRLLTGFRTAEALQAELEQSL
ncbi:MAG: DsbC family protein [Idiomarina sp.]|nr:DsbC family protein [Idiomarina sp.]